MTAGQPASPPTKRRWLRLKIAYKADILTLITFCLSVLSLAWQTVNYFEGAQVKLFAPDQIVIGHSAVVKFPGRYGGPYVHVMGRMSFVNEGAVGYNATIRRERVIVAVPGYPAFQQRWYQSVTSDAAGPQGTELTVDKLNDARPLPLLAGSSESHLTLFQPWPKECKASDTGCKPADDYVRWETFLERIKIARGFDLTFIADIYGEASPVTAKCHVQVTETDYNRLVAQRWGSPLCLPVAG